LKIVLYGFIFNMTVSVFSLFSWLKMTHG